MATLYNAFKVEFGNLYAVPELDPNQTNFAHAARDCMTNIDSADPMIQAILRADHLRGEARIGYSKRLSLVASAAGNKALQPVLTMHPQIVLN